jgi:hypothetical protein
MQFKNLFLAVFALWPHGSHALLEEKFVSFTPGNGSLDIARAAIVADSDDFVGVHIALKSLTSDLEQITGLRPALRNITGNSTALGNSSLPASRGAIIIGSVNSTLARQLADRGVIDLSDITGKWEMFKTAVVANPLVGVDRALLIIGSDKRGTIFGIHTLAEQSGQSP